MSTKSCGDPSECVDAVLPASALGKRRTIKPENARVHRSVQIRMDRTKDDKRPYAPEIPAKVIWEKWPDEASGRDLSADEQPDRQP